MITAIDLFAGAGGATRGLADAGFRVLAAIESDPAAAASYRANHPAVRLVESDIRTVDPAQLRCDLRLDPAELTLLKACPPCQSYSTLGKVNARDSRNDLVTEVWRFARAFGPRVVMVENVPGLARDHRLGRLMRQLRAVGYSVKTYTVDASNFGVPQRRRRLILIGLRDAPLPLPLDLSELLPRWFGAGALRNAGDALALASTVTPDTDPLHRPRRSSVTVAERLQALPIGGTRFDLPDRYQLSCHSNLHRREATASYGRVDPDSPAPTMTTRCTTPSCGQFVHPTEPRALTLREAATIQTFPLSYVFQGGAGQVERQIGNALPVRMAYGLGLCLRALLGNSLRQPRREQPA